MNNDNKICLLDGKGYVEFRKAWGTDNEVREAAVVSYKGFEESDYKTPLKQFLKNLIRKGHISPFEHVGLTLRIKAPIFVFRQFMRYRHANYNERSNRYSFASNDFYEPNHWRTNGGVVLSEEANQEINARYQKHCTESQELYQLLVDKGVKKELARIALPVSNYSELYWSANMSSIMHILRQRLDSCSQAELREYAKAILYFAKKNFPEIISAIEEVCLEKQEDLYFSDEIQKCAIQSTLVPSSK